MDTPQIICQNHEDCDARSTEIKPIKGFQAKEQVKGHTVSSEIRFFLFHLNLMRSSDGTFEV